MKKIIFLLAFMMMGLFVSAQNSLRTEGTSLIHIDASGNAATSGTYILPVIQGEADWSIQILPAIGGSALITPDSCYATVKIFYSNSSVLTTTGWSELRAKAVQLATTGTGGTAAIAHYFPLRDTIANTTVALSPGLIMEGSAFKGSRIKVHVDRPASIDTVDYRIYYVLKYPQTNPQR